MKRKLLITGAGGQMGQELKFLADRFPGFSFDFANSKDLDITRPGRIDGWFHKRNYFACINCAAYTAVDQAESQPALAYAVNRDGAGHLAEVCRKAGTYLLHLSTDYVYHTRQNRPFTEEDEIAPKGVYARSKAAGEQRVLAAGGTVIRTSWLYSSFGKNFVKTMLRLGTEGAELKVVVDQVGSPTWARDLARDLLTILKKLNDKELSPQNLQGIFNYSNEGVASWYDFAVAIFELKNRQVKVHPVDSSQFPTAAERPPYSLMSKARFRQQFNAALPHWRSSLKHCLLEL